MTPEDIDEAVTKTGKKVDYQTLSNFATLDTMVTVVDAVNVHDVLGSMETLAEKNVTGMVGNTGLRDPKVQKEENGLIAAPHCHRPGFWSTVKAAAWHVLTGGFGMGVEAQDVCC